MGYIRVSILAIVNKYDCDWVMRMCLNIPVLRIWHVLGYIRGGRFAMVNKYDFDRVIRICLSMPVWQLPWSSACH